MNNLPKDFQHPGGFVEEMMNFINDTAVCPQPMFALGAALTTAGLLYGQKVQGEDGQRTNIFTMAVGYTSSGKDHPLKTIARVLDECEASNLRLGQVTSDSAIEWALKRESRLCLLIDEAGHFFSGVSDPNAKGSPQHAIKPALLELWSSAGGRWVGKQRVPRDGKELPPLMIDNPHLCLYATTQPQILFDSMSKNDLRDGWLARNLFFISPSRPMPEPKMMKPIPNTIRGEVLAWKRNEGDPIITIPSDDEAKEVFKEFTLNIYRKMLFADKSGDETNYLYGKAAENAKRLALILAVSKHHERAVIGKEEAVFATTLVEYLISSMIEAVRKNVSETPDEKAKKQIAALVAAAGPKGLLKGELTRKTQALRRTLRDEYIADLVDAGEILELTANTCGARYISSEYSS